NTYYEAIDIKTFQKIQGTALDFLIVGAIASINIAVVIEYAVPLILITLLAIFITLFYFFYIGPRMFEKNWFENSIVNYGMMTGVVAVGLMLLRTVDPETETDTLAGFGLSSPIVSPIIGGGL